MNKAQKLCELASSIDKNKRTKIYLDFLLDTFEDEAEKGIFQDRVYFSSINSWNASCEKLVEMLREHGFDISVEYETLSNKDGYIQVSWAGKL